MRITALLPSPHRPVSKLSLVCFSKATPSGMLTTSIVLSIVDGTNRPPQGNLEQVLRKDMLPTHNPTSRHFQSQPYGAIPPQTSRSMCVPLIILIYWRRITLEIYVSMISTLPIPGLVQDLSQNTLPLQVSRGFSHCGLYSSHAGLSSLGQSLLSEHPWSLTWHATTAGTIVVVQERAKHFAYFAKCCTLYRNTVEDWITQILKW